jgi:raffinose/stachyose/melibiose transport system substrate-binding protein
MKRIFGLAVLAASLVFVAGLVAQQKAVLNVWTTWTADQGKVDTFENFIQDYMKRNPNVTIEKTFVAWADLRTMITPALKSGVGPDVFNYTPGPGYVGVMAKAGLLMPLDDMVTRYNWKNIFPEWYFREHQIDGKQYGMSNSDTLLGLYYNKQMFRDAAIAVPKTYEEFIAACERFRARGITPVAMSLKDQWQAFHYVSIFWTAFAGARPYIDAAYSLKGFDSQPFADSLSRLAELVTKGYTYRDPNGVAYADANTEFKAGKVPMSMTGTWMNSDYYNAMKDNVGFFSLPPLAGRPQELVGGTGDEWVISSKTRYPDAAKELVNAIVTSTDAWVQTYVPVSRIPAGYTSPYFTPIVKEVYDVIQGAKAIAPISDLVFNLPGNEKIKSETQRLVAGRTTPMDMMRQLQAALDSGK